MSIPTIASMSTIPPRFGDLGPTLLSLLNQSHPFDEIRVYVPGSYRRFPDWDGSLPNLPGNVSLHRTDRDLGPATKVLPAARDLRGMEVDIFFCDDDKKYHPDLHRQFKQAASDRPGTCIVGAGQDLPDIARSDRPPHRRSRAKQAGKGPWYKLFRALSLGLVKPGLEWQSGYVDLLAGYGGVLVRPDWFDDEAFDCPEIMWTVDDMWLSGQLERRGIPIWLEGGNPVKGTGIGANNSLAKRVEQGYGRVEANLLVIDHFRQVYGLWPKSQGAPEEHGGLSPSMRELARRQRAKLELP